MMTEILPDINVPFKTHKCDQLDKGSSYVETEPASGSIVIQVSLER